MNDDQIQQIKYLSFEIGVHQTLTCVSEEIHQTLQDISSKIQSLTQEVKAGEVNKEEGFSRLATIHQTSFSSLCQRLAQIKPEDLPKFLD